MKSLKSVTISIKGTDWKFLLLSDKQFDKLHNSSGNPEEDNNVAMTMGGKTEVHFRNSDLDPITIRHELGHVLYRASLVGSSGLTSDQVEETMCEIIGHHVPDMVVWSDRILNVFLGE